MVPILIIHATPAYHAAIRDINKRAFGRGDEARLVDDLREAGDLLLSLVAVDTGIAEAVGHIAFSRITIVGEDRRTPAVTLAPMAVLPERQRDGVGSQLIHSGLQRLREAGEEIIIVLGHPEYYPRFGFESALAAALRAPFDVPQNAWMALELVPGALTGVNGRVEYAAAFSQL